MKTFNAFQMMCLYVAMPFIIGWLNTGPFSYSSAIKWLSIAVYVVMFVFGVVIIRWFMDECNDKK